MTAKELRELDGAALQKELDALLREQFNLRMQRGSGQATKSHQMTRVRRAIARIKTIVHQKAMAQG